MTSAIWRPERARTRSSWTRPAMPTWSTGRGSRSWRRRSPAARSAADLLPARRLPGLLQHLRPEPDVLALVPDSGFQREPHPGGHVAVVALHRLVGGQPLLVPFQLSLGERCRISAAEELEQPGIAQLVEVDVQVGTPVFERPPARR